MKRTVCLALALCMALGLSGCKKPVDPNNCAHEKHDPETTRCLACDKKIDHRYVGDTCKLCGKKTEFKWDSISTDQALMEILKNGGHEHKGTVEPMTYETYAYNISALTGEEKTIEKTAYVYLPYGYDATKQYDVLVFLHGSTDDAGYWFAQDPYTPEDTTYVGTGNYTKELLDYMIGEGLCGECIVVTPSLYNDHDNYKEENGVLAPLLGHELVESLLPAVVEKYATYAAGPDDLAANRDHFAYAGFSMGSMTGFASIFSYCLPYFSYIGSFSGPASDVDAVIEAVNSAEYRDYAINYWYCGVGDQDRTGGNFYQDVRKTYKQMVGRIDRLTDGENCAMVDIYYGNHTYECALTNLYNALLKFFK